MYVDQPHQCRWEKWGLKAGEVGKVHVKHMLVPGLELQLCCAWGQTSIPPRPRGGTLSCARGALSTCRMG